MNYEHTPLQGVLLCEPRVIGDQRGYFMETWRAEDFDRAVGEHVEFIQDNESRSTCGVVRGLHYQCGEASQAKLVRVLQGSVLDVAVDLRRQSPSYGKHVAVILSEENKRQLFLPRGMAHGFMVLSSVAVFAYKVDNRWTPEAERTLRWDDPTVGIDWPELPAGQQPVLSEKDLGRALSWDQADKF